MELVPYVCGMCAHERVASLPLSFKAIHTSFRVGEIHCGTFTLWLSRMRRVSRA